MKKWIILLLSALLVLTMAACGQTSGESEQGAAPEEINIAVLSGPTGMGMAKLMEDSAKEETETAYRFAVSTDPSDVLAKVISGEYDIAALPTNSAAAAYKKSEGAVRLLAINTYGTLYLLQNQAMESETPTEIADLKGKTIAAFGEGANPEYILDYVLTQNGLTIGEDVMVQFYPTAEEVMTAAVAGTAAYVMLPEPSASVLRSKKDGMVTIFDLTSVWDNCADSPLVMGSLVVSAEFAEAYPEAVADFLQEYAASVAYTHSNPEEAAALIAAHGIVPNAAIAASALEFCNLICITGAEMQETVEGYYEILFDYNPAAVGGAVPDEAFYYTAK